MSTEVEPRFENIEALLDEYETEEYDEQRDEERYPLVRPARLLMDDGSIIHGLFTRDISAVGIGTIGANELATGMVAYIAIHSLEQYDDIVLKAAVKWCKPYGYGYYATGWTILSDVK